MKERVTALGHKLAVAQTIIVLSVIYWLVVPAYSLFVKRRRRAGSGWSPWGIRSDLLEDLQRQF